MTLPTRHNGFRRGQTRGYFQRLHEHSTRGAERSDPDECACNGSGWILSSCDVWEKCSRHYDGQEHPEHRTSEAEAERHHELYVQMCREERIDDRSEAHRRALEEKRKRETEEDLPWGETDGEEAGGAGDTGDPELPF